MNRLRHRYGRSKVTSIEKWLPWNLCLDSGRDASALVDSFMKKFGVRFGLAEAIYNRLYGEPFCTDDPADRRKVINILKRYLS